MYQPADSRPRFLDLKKFKFPLNAKLSILHRISGLLLLISLIGYLALFNLIAWHPSVTYEAIQSHCILLCAHSFFWLGALWHWLTGIRHLAAEHFLQETHYRLINHPSLSQLLILTWIGLSMIALWRIW